MNALLDRLAPYKLAFEIAVFGALVVVAMVGVHRFLENERDIGRAEVRAEYAKQLADAKDAAKKVEDDWRARYNTAIQQRADNEKALLAAAAAAAASSGSLRDTITELRSRLPNATAEASRAYASTAAALLADCEGRYRAMGQSAAGHAGDAQP